MNELLARAALFSAIEAGHPFWSSEISTQGALVVYEKLLSGGYDSIKNEKLISTLRQINADQVLTEIGKYQARLITPIEADWPEQVNDLAAPPIGLIMKGNISALHQPSLAIVGTRNPTSYGARIAGDFAAGFEEGLRGLLEEIMDPLVPFDQTDDKKKCSYCAYQELCGR